MTSADYWQRLPPFDHIVTYSFNRGPKLERLEQAAEQLIASTRLELLTARFMRQPVLRRRLADLAKRNDLQMLRLTDAHQAFHLTATPVALLRPTDGAVKQLQATLQLPLVNHWMAMCWPIFRDALVFYDAAGRSSSVLNICFQCSYMQDEHGQDIAADAAVFTQLKALLQRLGHPISDGHEGPSQRQ